MSTIARAMDDRTTMVNASGIVNEDTLERGEQGPWNEIRVGWCDNNTYRNNYMECIRIPKGRSVGEAVMIHNVRDISEEWQMTRNKSLQLAFYDCHQFEVSRGYLRNAASHPDLAEGIRWLILIRTGGFSELEDIEKKVKKTIETHRCSLCKGRILDRIWVHFILHCTHEWV